MPPSLTYKIPYHLPWSGAAQLRASDKSKSCSQIHSSFLEDKVDYGIGFLVLARQPMYSLMGQYNPMP
jgi:hypothetical protein